jgi:hypothetical protein
MIEKTNKIQVSEYTESADEFCNRMFEEINSTGGFKNISEVKDWVENFGISEQEQNDELLEEDSDKKKIKDIYWVHNPNYPNLGVGFVNYPFKDLEVGIYFQDPDWYEGQVCRVNNQYDIALFIQIARELKNYDEAGEVQVSTTELNMEALSN